VTDFGIARSGASQMTEAGSIVGTAQYLSPEQARGAPVDPRSDLYSLGIVLYEMLTGKVPFTGDTPVEIAMKHLSAVPEPPSALREGVPHDLDAVVMRALAKDPAQRYGSAEEMDADLARVARGVAVSSKTEEALTQVLSGAGAATAATMVSRPRSVTPPPAPPAYRPPSQYYDYEEPPPRRRFWPWLLGLLAVGLAAAGGWLLYDQIQDELNANRPVDVPNVALLEEQLAKQKISDAGLNPRVLHRAYAKVPLGAVGEQNPQAGDPVAKDSTVTIWVSTGKPRSTVPDVKGHPLSDAIQALASVRLKPNIVYIYSAAQENTVTAQFPPAGDRVLSGSTVRINVSRGPKPVSVPDVRGQPYENAAGALQGAGFKVTRVDVESDEAEGVVVQQDPPAGTSVPNGTNVTLSVSKGPAPSEVPDVTVQTQPEAESILRGAGFDVATVSQDVTDPSQDGIVLEQDPKGGAKVEPGTVVTITVGSLVESTGDNSGAEAPPAIPPADTTTTPAATPTPTPAPTTTP
jgi:beta-lactam-binding protein with PASTA domain